MRVLEVTGTFPVPPEGGLEVAVLSLTRELSRLGVSVRIVAATDLHKNVQSDGFKVIGLPSIGLTKWVRVPRPKSLVAIHQAILQADVVHIHNPQELFNLVAAILTLLSGKPLCLSLLSPGTLHRHPTKLFRLPGRIVDGCLRALIRRSSFVQVKNQIDYATVCGLNSNTRMVPDGVPDELFSAQSGGDAFKARYHLEGQEPILLFAGRLHPLKGPDHLVRVLPILIERFPGVVAVIAGPDSSSMTPNLNRLAKELGVEARVKIVGCLDEKEKIAAIDAASLIVVPSLADFVEGFSIIASEAWARGKPVVGYPSGALKTRIVDGRNGALALAVSVPELADAVARALVMGPILPVEDVVLWSKVAQQILEAYSGIIGVRWVP